MSKIHVSGFMILAFAAGLLTHSLYVRQQQKHMAQQWQKEWAQMVQVQQELDWQVRSAHQQFELQLAENQKVIQQLDSRERFTRHRIDSLKNQIQESDSSRRAFLYAWKQSLDVEAQP